MLPARLPDDSAARPAARGASFAAAWGAHERLKNIDRELADPETFTTALFAVQAEIELEMERAIEMLERTPHDPACQREVEALEGERSVTRRGPEQFTASIVGLPGRLVQRLAARGVTPLPGCLHVFERRGGLLTLEPRLADLRRERAAAMEVLTRELELS